MSVADQLYSEKARKDPFARLAETVPANSVRSLGRLFLDRISLSQIILWWLTGHVRITRERVGIRAEWHVGLTEKGRARASSLQENV